MLRLLLTVYSRNRAEQAAQAAQVATAPPPRLLSPFGAELSYDAELPTNADDAVRAGWQLVGAEPSDSAEPRRWHLTTEVEPCIVDLSYSLEVR